MKDGVKQPLLKNENEEERNEKLVARAQEYVTKRLKELKLILEYIEKKGISLELSGTPYIPPPLPPQAPLTPMSKAAKKLQQLKNAEMHKSKAQPAESSQGERRRSVRLRGKV